MTMVLDWLGQLLPFSCQFQPIESNFLDYSLKYLISTGNSGVMGYDAFYRLGVGFRNKDMYDIHPPFHDVIFVFYSLSQS